MPHHCHVPAPVHLAFVDGYKVGGLESRPLIGDTQSYCTIMQVQYDYRHARRDSQGDLVLGARRSGIQHSRPLYRHNYGKTNFVHQRKSTLLAIDYNKTVLYGAKEKHSLHRVHRLFRTNQPCEFGSLGLRVFFKCNKLNVGVFRSLYAVNCPLKKYGYIARNNVFAALIPNHCLPELASEICG
jgi:hypothetical protein